MPLPETRCTPKQRAWLAARGISLPPWASRKKATGIITGLQFKEKQMKKDGHLTSSQEANGDGIGDVLS